MKKTKFPNLETPVLAGAVRPLTRKIIVLSLIAAVALTLFGGSFAYAASTTWLNSGTSTDFNTDSNWSNLAPVTGGTAVFITSGSNLIADVSVSGTTKQLNFGIAATDLGASGYDLTSANNSTLFLTSGISTFNTSGTNTFDVALNFSNGATVSGTTGNTLVFNKGVTVNGASGLSLGNANNMKYVFNGGFSGTGFLKLQGTFTLTVASTLSGTSQLGGSSGTAIVTVGDKAAFGTSILLLSNNGGSITASTPMTIAGGNAIGNAIVFNTTANTAGITLSGTNAIDLTGNVDLGNANRLLTITAPTSTWSGILSGSGGVIVNSGGTGVLTLAGSNTYSGPTIIAGSGSIKVSNMGMTGAASNIGTSGTLNFGNSSGSAANYKLIYAGAGETTDKVILLSNTGSQIPSYFIDNSGSGLLNFTSNFQVTGTASVTRTLTLMGSTSGTGQLAGAIPNAPASAVAIAKTGTGKWVLSGTNSYTGGTAVSGGTLVLDGNSGGSLGASAVSVSATAGAVLQVNGNYTIGTATGGTLTVSGGTSPNQGTLSLVDGKANTLTLANDSAADVFTIGSVGVNQPSIMSMDVGATSDEIIIGASTSKVNLKINGSTAAATLNLTGLGTLTAGTQTLISAPGGTGVAAGTRGTFANGFVIGTTTGNFHGCTVTLGTLGSGTTGLTLIATANAAPASAYWNGVNGDGVWNSFTSGTANISNFSTDAGLTTNANGLLGAASNVTFGSGASASTTLGENLAINSLTLNATGAVSVGGTNTLTINATSANGNTAGNGITVGTGAGNHTISTKVALGNDQTWTVTDSGNTLTASNQISGAQALTKAGAGTLVLSGTSTYSGATTVAGGTLVVSGSLGGTTSITVANSGSKLQLGASDRINNAAPLTLSTGVLDTQGHNQTFQTLTSTGSSVLDLGTGASILNFASSSGQTWTGTLSIYNWTGTAVTGGGTDQVIFASQGLTQAQLDSINFYSDAGTTLLGTATWASGNVNEIVAIPEPSTWVMMMSGFGFLAMLRRKRAFRK